MSNLDYIRHVDDVILALADKQTGPNLTPINLEELYVEKFAHCPPTWIQTIVGELERRGYGLDRGTLNSRVFMINGAALVRASEIRNERRRKSVADMLRQWTRTDWIALGALIVSILSLVVSIVALSKPDQ